MTNEETAIVQALVAKLDVIVPIVDGYIGMTHMRSGGQYTGPNLIKELAAVKRLVVTQVSPPPTGSGEIAIRFAVVDWILIAGLVFAVGLLVYACGYSHGRRSQFSRTSSVSDTGELSSPSPEPGERT